MLGKNQSKQKRKLRAMSKGRRARALERAAEARKRRRAKLRACPRRVIERTVKHLDPVKVTKTAIGRLQLTPVLPWKMPAPQQAEQIIFIDEGDGLVKTKDRQGNIKVLGPEENRGLGLVMHGKTFPDQGS